MLIKNNVLADKFVIELKKVFEEHNWNIEECVDGEISIFDMFCKRLEELETDLDREFMIELTRKYLIVGFDDYEKHMEAVFKIFLKRNKEWIKYIETIHMFPVQDKDYPSKTKSGNVMCYLFQNIYMRKFEECRNKRIRIIETYNGLEKYKEDIKCLLLIDDFVGSGDTVLECINQIEGRKIEKENIKVLTLVSQEYGKKVVEDYGVDIYSAILRNKAITDNYPKEEIPKKIDQMKKISKTIKVKDKNLYLGYKGSEGLVSMIKTPNNTFPFYWYERKKNGEFTLAPFARRNNIGVDE